MAEVKKSEITEQVVSIDSSYQSEFFCQGHMRIPVGDMVFHVFGVANNKKYPGWCFKNDRHDHHELIYTIRGHGHYEIRGQTIRSGAGDIYFTPRNELHHGAIAPDEDLWESLVVEMDFSFARDPELYLDDLAMFPVVLPFYRHFILEKHVSLRVSPELRPQIGLVVERLSLEVANHPFDYDVVLQSQMLELLALICRAAREEMGSVPLRQYAEHARGLLRLEKARQYIGANYARKLCVKEIADQAFISPFHFLRLFKEAFGMTPIQYQSHLRISEAKRMLVSTDAQVSQIGYQLGYSSPEHFSRQFAAKVGVSPSNYTGSLVKRMEEGKATRAARAGRKTSTETSDTSSQKH
jgi:AraC-like DNA-binding protein